MVEAQLVRCQNCGAMNRVAVDKMSGGRAAVCGKCKILLGSGSGPLKVTDETFSEAVERSPLLVLLDLWAPWCGPCRMVGPAVDELAKEMAGRVRVAKMNVDDNPITSDRFTIRSIPALLIFRNGEEIDRLVGAQPKAEIIRHLERFL